MSNVRDLLHPTHPTRCRKSIVVSRFPTARTEYVFHGRAEQRRMWGGGVYEGARICMTSNHIIPIIITCLRYKHYLHCICLECQGALNSYAPTGEGSRKRPQQRGGGKGRRRGGGATSEVGVCCAWILAPPTTSHHQMRLRSDEDLQLALYDVWMYEYHDSRGVPRFPSA